MISILRQTLLAALAALTWASAAGSPDPLRFGVVPTESAGALRRDYEPIRIALEQTLERPVQMFFAPDYTSVIEALRFGKLELALLGNNAAIDAIDRAGGTVIAQAVNTEGVAGYWSLIIVAHDSPVQSLQDLIDRRTRLTLGLGDAQSTSGNLVPGYYAFGRNGINPTRDFKATRLATHEANILAVAKGQIDACATSSETLERLLERQPPLRARLREVWRSPLIPSDPLVVKTSLPEATRAAVQTFFVAYGSTPQGRAALGRLTWSAFQVSSDTQLHPLRILRLQRERTLVEADPSLAPAAREQRIADLAARIEALAGEAR